MRFSPLFLFSYQENGRDALGNPIKQLVKNSEVDGLFSPWTAEEIALDVRDVTKLNRKIITRASRASLEQADKVSFEGLYHSIMEIRGDDTTRWRLLVVNRYGSVSP